MNRDPSKEYMALPRYDTRVARLTCPKCKKLGTLVYEAMPARWSSHQARTIHELSPGFVSIDHNAVEDARIECKKCRIPAREN